jgi:hypothetical protein
MIYVYSTKTESLLFRFAYIEGRDAFHGSKLGKWFKLYKEAEKFKEYEEKSKKQKKLLTLKEILKDVRDKLETHDVYFDGRKILDVGINNLVLIFDYDRYVIFHFDSNEWTKEDLKILKEDRLRSVVKGF